MWWAVAGALIGLGWVAWEVWDRWMDWKIERENDEAWWAWEEDVRAWKREQGEGGAGEAFFAEWEAKNKAGMAWMDW